MSELLYRTSGLRHWKANSMTAMTGRWYNDTSVKSKVERDKTVVTKEGGCGRSSRWWNSNGVKCMTVWCVPCRRASRINSDNRIAWNLELPKTIDIIPTAEDFLFFAVGVFRRKLLKEGVKMLGFMIGLFVGAFIGVCVMCFCNAAAKADEQMEDHINDKNKK